LDLSALEMVLVVHRITGWSGLEGTSVGHPVQPPCPSRVTQSRLHRTLSRRGLNISREGDSTTSLGVDEAVKSVEIWVREALGRAQLLAALVASLLVHP